MNMTEEISELNYRQKKQLISNAVEGLKLNSEDTKLLTYLVNQEYPVVTAFCNLMLKARMQSDG